MSLTSNVLIRANDTSEEVVRVLGDLGLVFRTGRNALDETI